MLHYLWEFFQNFSGQSLEDCFVFTIKVGLSPVKKIVLFASLKTTLETMKNAFYFILKALFVLILFKILSWLFGHVEKRLD